MKKENQPLIVVSDAAHSAKEKRHAAFGVTDGGRKLTVVLTLRGKRIRVMCAHDMTAKERRYYEKHAQKNTSV